MGKKVQPKDIEQLRKIHGAAPEPKPVDYDLVTIIIPLPDTTDNNAT